MKVLVAGATGFTGSRVVPLLLEQRHSVRCFVRKNSSLERLPVERVDLAYGSFEEIDSFAKALKGMDLFLNIASLGFGHGPEIVAAVENSGVKRALFTGTTAVFTQLNAPSKVVRLAAEEVIYASSLDFTILRPTMIYGAIGDRNMSRLVNYLVKWPIIPVLGSGKFLQQPVHVDDLAQAIIRAALEERCIRKDYNVSGANPLSYVEVIDTLNELMGRAVKKVHLSASLAVLVLRMAEAIGIRLPIKAEQVQRLNEDKAFCHREAQVDFGYNPIDF
jgi:nucleoside-diphosphate-sugar epimerase